MEIQKLKDICLTEITDGTHQTPTYSEYGYIFLSSKNVTTQKIDWDNVMFIPEKLHEELYKRVAPQIDDILLAKNGTTGVAAIVDRDIVFDIYVSLALIRPNTEIVMPRYLLYAINNPVVKGYFDSSLKGIGVPNLHLKNIRETPIKIYDLETQKAIVEKLDKVCELISLRKQQLEKLDELVKARFVEMFGEPSSNPMGWLQTTVGAECYYIKDGPHKSLTDVGMENGYPFISVRNIVNGYIDFSTAKYISEADYKDAIKKCCPEKGDILYSKGGTTGIAKLVDIDIKFANWVHLAVLKFNHNEFNGSFFEKMLNCDYCYKQSQMLTKGIANRDLVLSAMAQIKIYKPPILLQNQFAAFVERIDQQKQTVQQSLEKLELMKKALMQEYFG